VVADVVAGLVDLLDDDDVQPVATARHTATARTAAACRADARCPARRVR
jgi:hypothetical protein